MRGRFIRGAHATTLAPRWTIRRRWQAAPHRRHEYACSFVRSLACDRIELRCDRIVIGASRKAVLSDAVPVS
ncbi:hypothetical protein C7S17_2654 [Burkholderia thailandensis]|nr:hypothetical protein [Burkholderia thailandensis]